MKNTAVVECQMLIRRSISDVFQAFIDPSITAKFWFTKSSGKLAAGENFKWEWEMYDVSVDVFVREIIENRNISIEWGEPAVSVDFEFRPFDGHTYVVIKNYGFKESGDDLLDAVKNNTGGFTTVLAGLKAWMEHGINLNLVADMFPGRTKKS